MPADPEFDRPQDVLDAPSRERDGMTAAELDGFERGMGLHPDAWRGIAESDDEEATASLGMIPALHELNHRPAALPERAQDELEWLAPPPIPLFMRSLNDWTKSRHDAAQGGGAGSHAPFDRGPARAFGRKVGRNEPCPCGSGRKYKRCCGAR